MKTLMVVVADDIVIYEPTIFEIVIQELADMAGLYAVITAFSTEVIRYAESKGCFN